MKTKTLLMITALSLPFTLAMSAQAQSGDRAAFKAAFEACISENGLTKPAPGQRPSDADRQTLDTCMAGKGFDRGARPHHGGRGHHEGQPPPQAPSDSEGATAQ